MNFDEVESDYDTKKESLFLGFKTKMQTTKDVSLKVKLEENFRSKMKSLRKDYASRMEKLIAQKLSQDQSTKLRTGIKNKMADRKTFLKDEAEVAKSSQDLASESAKSAKEAIIVEEKRKKDFKKEHERIVWQTQHRHLLNWLAVRKSRYRRWKRKYVSPITDWLKIKKNRIIDKLDPLKEFMKKYWKMLMK